MKTKFDIVILGASYGSLLGTKLAMAGHNVTLICLPTEVELINTHGAIVRMPVRGRDSLVEINSQSLPGKLTAAGPEQAMPERHDLVVLAMQEPQYGSPGVRSLMERVAQSRVPTMSIMNMPPLTYLARIPAIDLADVRQAYKDPAIWDMFDPALMTLCSPDPQAFRPPNQGANVLQVRLPTNFKAARFVGDDHTAMLERIAADVEAARFEADGESLDIPVKLRVHQSVFVPLAKWSMLITGNYRCIGADGARSIHDAVHTDIALSRSIYEWVSALCVSLGAAPGDLVPFDKYANAALSLGSPSSAARALTAGATAIERVDLLVQLIAKGRGIKLDELDRTVSTVDGWLNKNQSAKVA